MTEKQIQNSIIREFGTKGWLRIWRANVGVARINRRVVRFGVPGQADLSGILYPGVRLEIEVKQQTGRQSQDQKNFQRMVERMGGLYILARSVKEVEDAIDIFKRKHPSVLRASSQD